MTGISIQAAPRSRLLEPRRLLGVDVARGLALIGMMSVHIIPALDADGGVSWAYRISSGRASALFAVLAGLSLVLANRPRGDEPPQPGARHGVIARAAFIAGVGLFLGRLESGVAVILVHYAVLFAIGTLFMGMGARALMVTGAGWLLLSPVVGYLLRPLLPTGPGSSPSLVSLAHPVELLTTVLFTGYYPVLQWTGYLLVGMALGRLPLRRTGTGLWLLTLGALLAGGTKFLSALLLGPAGGFERLTVPLSSVLAGRDLATVLQTGTYGTTPSTSWWWLAVSAPHSGTPLDLLHTTGTALAVIGGCQFLAAALHGRWRWLVLPVAAAGSMTLTLYTLHVAALAAVRSAVSAPEVSSPTALWAVNAILALVLASAWQFTGRRGPLEAVAADMSAAARQSVTIPRSSRPDD
ncbi:heparan-alpha-glucosaminide N-acetyltransferase domain-containing protein [uncultured Nocardioides sp.]|uniref:heparan-alpha-glucosaminide N-acetyltransferase domain-containing protein n=1 Tax=uncultured Nocardioides sp. TaxID=198441 RepID=UPI0030FD0590